MMTTTDEPVHSARPAAPEVATQPERRERAIRRVAALKGFYTHLGVYLAVNLGLVAVDALSGANWWVQWVWLGWGIGVAAHGLAVFGRGSRMVAEWEERKIREIMAEG